MKNVIGTIYLLHFSRPYKHAKHYVGWALDLDRRLKEHRQGNGANLIAVIQADGITWELARTWVGDRYRERQLKQRGKSRACPICRLEALEGSLREVTPMHDRNWRDHARCVDVDAEVFFPVNDLLGWQPGEAAKAKAICWACPVSAECLDWAMDRGDPWAVLGGTTPEERSLLRRQAA